MARQAKVSMTVHLPPDVVAELKSEQFGDSISQVIGDRLRQAYKMGPREAAPLSPLEVAALRKAEAEAQMAEQRAAIMQKEFWPREAVLASVRRRFDVVRSRVKIIPTQIRDLTPEQMFDGEKAVEDCFTDLSTSQCAAEWDDLPVKI